MKPTVPIAPNFHESKGGARLRTHMDTANQNINPTMRALKKKLNKDLETRDEKIEAPASTSKHEGLMALRRKQLDARRDEEEKKKSEEAARKTK